MLFYICNDCVKDKNLKMMINDHLEDGICSICKKNDTGLNLQKNNNFVLLVKALLRYHYSESDYNPNIGGKYDTLSIFKDENEIFNFKIPENITKELLNEKNSIYSHIIPFNLYGEGVSLYHKEATGERGWFMSPFKDEFDDIERRTSLLNPNLIKKQLKNKFVEFIELILKKTSINTQNFYRARIGTDKSYFEYDYPYKKWLKYDQDNDIRANTEFEYYAKTIIQTPYCKKAISAPPPYRVGEGRLNRKGYSYLYLASDLDTAISEVIPKINYNVSIGKFVVKENLIIVDFTNISLYKNYYQDDDHFYYFKFIRTIANILSTPKEKEQYNFTQTISDTLNELGFDGIAYITDITYYYLIAIMLNIFKIQAI